MVADSIRIVDVDGTRRAVLGAGFLAYNGICGRNVVVDEVIVTSVLVVEIVYVLELY